MPYKDKEKDRDWHRAYMRRKRAVTPAPDVTPKTLDPVTPKPFAGPLTKERQAVGFNVSKAAAIAALLVGG